MDMSDKLKALTAGLLKARQELLEAQAAHHDARKLYESAEADFLTAAGAAAPTDSDPQWPEKVIVGDLVIMARDEWWDLKAGQRLEFHTVVRVPE